MPIVGEHAAYISRLPPIHRDPLDRLLVAQALTEPMRLLTDDAVLGGYGDVRLRSLRSVVRPQARDHHGSRYQVSPSACTTARKRGWSRSASKPGSTMRNPGCE